MVSHFLHGHAVVAWLLFGLLHMLRSTADGLSAQIGAVRWTWKLKKIKAGDQNYISAEPVAVRTTLLE